MPDWNQQFLADPQKFARQWALYPAQDNTFTADDSPAFTMDGAHQKKKALSNGRWLYQMQRTNKVRYCQIRKPAGRGLSGDFGHAYDTDLNLLMMEIADQATTGSFPVYYLPWTEDGTVRIKLKPSRTLLRENVAVPDPDVFVTPAVQGCSIFIDGTEQEPVVYHINALKTGGAVFDRKIDDAKAREFAAAKIQDMRQRHAQAKEAHSKDAAPLVGGQPSPRYSTAAHMTDYMDEFVTRSGHAGLDQRHGASIWNLWGLMGSGGNTETIQAGSIFGIRRDGRWTFYRQTRTRVTYDVWFPSIGSYMADVKRESEWVATQCVEFWPCKQG